jgi:hypothetical protein
MGGFFCAPFVIGCIIAHHCTPLHCIEERMKGMALAAAAGTAAGFESKLKKAVGIL